MLLYLAMVWLHMLYLATASRYVGRKVPPACCVFRPPDVPPPSHACALRAAWVQNDGTAVQGPGPVTHIASAPSQVKDYVVRFAKAEDVAALEAEEKHKGPHHEGEAMSEDEEGEWAAVGCSLIPVRVWGPELAAP